MTVVIFQIIVANSLPIAEGKSEVWIHPLIICCYINRRGQHGSMKCFIIPQYLVEPQHTEGYLDEMWIVRPDTCRRE